MRVLFNGVSTLRPKTGVGQTTEHLHRALTAISPEDRFWLYPGHALRTGMSWFLKAPAAGPPAPPRPTIASRLRAATLTTARLGYAAHFHVVARLGGFDLYHEPNLVPFAVHLPTVVTVHDLSVLLYPQWHPPERVKRYEQSFGRGIERAAHIVVASETIRREAIEHLGLDSNRVSTVHNGIGAAFGPQSPERVAHLRQRLGLPPRYLLYVGTIEPRKNLGMLLRAFCDLPAEHRSQCPLMLAGKWGWKTEPEREFFETEARHRGVRLLGYVPDDDLPALYAGATALLYPSFYEGFGLPPVEAMACGCPAIVSTAAAVQEVVGGQAVSLDPNDLAGWREAMIRAIADPDSLEEYRRGGPAHAASFDWARSARMMLDVYRRVLGLPAERSSASESARAA